MSLGVSESRDIEVIDFVDNKYIFYPDNCYLGWELLTKIQNSSKYMILGKNDFPCWKWLTHVEHAQQYMYNVWFKHILHIALGFFNGGKTKEIRSLWVQLARNRGTKTVFFLWMQNYYALEWFSEAESACIRSAVKFCFDIDVRNFFSTLLKIFFSIDPKFLWIFWGFFHFFRNFEK